MLCNAPCSRKLAVPTGLHLGHAHRPILARSVCVDSVAAQVKSLLSVNFCRLFGYLFSKKQSQQGA